MKINKMGVINYIYEITSVVIRKLAVYLKIFFLSVRGFDVSYYSFISSSVLFFQSTKHAVSLGSGSEIGSGVRIKAGFHGKIAIGKNVLIDDYTFISAHKLISIGDNTMIAAACYIVDFNHIFPLSSYKTRLDEDSYSNKEIIIGKNVWIGTHTVILSGVTIGDGVVVGAGSVVTKNIPSYTLAVGNPAKAIKKLNGQ